MCLYSVLQVPARTGSGRGHDDKRFLAHTDLKVIHIFTIWLYTRSRVHTHTHTQTPARVCIHMHAHIYTHARADTHIHTHTHTPKVLHLFWPEIILYTIFKATCISQCFITGVVTFTVLAPLTTTCIHRWNHETCMYMGDMEFWREYSPTMHRDSFGYMLYCICYSGCVLVKDNLTVGIGNMTSIIEDSRRNNARENALCKWISYHAAFV